MAHLDTLNIVAKPNIRPVTAADHKSAIQVSNTAELPEVIHMLIRAVDAGELDLQLSEIISERQFIPEKPVSKRKTA